MRPGFLDEVDAFIESGLLAAPGGAPAVLRPPACGRSSRGSSAVLRDERERL
jgi:hypothetical protein